MPIHYSIQPEEGLVEVVWSGTIDAGHLKTHWQTILTDPEARQLGKSLVDVRRATIGFRGHEMDDLLKSVALPLLGDLKWKSAIIVNNPVHYGVSRQYQVFAEGYNQNAIFHDPDAARAWLKEA